MSLIIGNTYILTFDISDKVLTFTGIILENNDDDFIKFSDKYGEILNYKKSLLIAYKEVQK